MAGQMHAATGFASDRFQHLDLIRNLRIAGGAALECSAISEETGGHASKLVVASGTHESPCAAVLYDPGTGTIVGPLPHSP